MESRRCGAEEARQNLPSLLERAHHGDITIITRHGRPYAALVPIEAVPQPVRGPSMRSLRGSGRGLWGPEPAEAIARMRDEW